MSEVNSRIIIALIVLSITSLLVNVGFLFYLSRPNVTIQIVQPTKEDVVPLVSPKDFE